MKELVTVAAEAKVREIKRGSCYAGLVKGAK